MLSLVLSVVAYLVASVLITRYLEGMGVPKGMTRGFVVFVLALAVAYGMAFLVDLVSARSASGPNEQLSAQQKIPDKWPGLRR